MIKKVLLVAAMAGLAMPMASQAWQSEKDVSVIVAYKAGSGTDKTARVLMMHVEKAIGKAMVIQNLPGGDGKIGWTKLIKSRADGYTIGFINLPTFTTLANEKNAMFKYDDVLPIANHVTETGVVVVKADSPYKTLKELVAAAKSNPNLKASTNGNHASNHLSAQLLAKSAGFKYQAIPYGGTKDQLLALRQGEVDFSCVKVADVAGLYEGANPELRVLGVYDTKRAPELPDVPTLGELGYYNQWYGSSRAIVGPKKMPKEIQQYWVETLKKVMSDPEVIAAHKKAKITINFMDDKELGALIKAQDQFAKDTASIWD